MPWHLTKINPKGAKAEKFALCYLKKQGLKRLDTNFATAFGEIDLIMLDSETLVFVEVRFRSSNQFGSALESITPKKITKIRKTAKIFIQHNSKYRHKYCRFDTVTITNNDENINNNLEWIKGAF